VQVNGKLRARLLAPAGLDRVGLESFAKADERVTALLAGKSIKKVIVVLASSSISSSKAAEPPPRHFPAATGFRAKTWYDLATS